MTPLRSFNFIEPEFSFPLTNVRGKENSVVNLTILSKSIFTIMFLIGKARSVVTTPNKLRPNSLPGLLF